MKRWLAIAVMAACVTVVVVVITAKRSKPCQRPITATAASVPSRRGSADAVRALLPEWEVVRQVLTADVNGDGRTETLAFVHDWFHGTLPDLVLYVLVPKGTEGGLAIARKLTLGSLLTLNAEVLPEVKDALRLGMPQVSMHACGVDHTRLIVLTLGGREYSPRVLYSEPVHGSAEIIPWRGKEPARIIEHWAIWNLYGGEVPAQLRGHVLARRTYAWEARAKRFTFKTTEPDVEAEQRLSPDELRRVPGAKVLLKGK